MSIQTEIDRIVLAKSSLRDALINKGATLTAGALLEDFVDAVNNMQVGGGSTEIPAVSVTADKLLSGVTAINSDGNVVTGNIPTVALTQDGYTVSIDKGYTEGGSVTIEVPDAPDYYEASVTVSGNKVTITAGLIEAQTVTIPEGAVSLDGGYISVRAGYVDNDEIALPVSSSEVSGNEVTIHSGWVNEDYSTFVEDAEISYDDDRVVVGVGWVGEELVIEKGSTSLPTVSFNAAGLREGMSAIDSSGNVVNGSMKNVSISIDGNNVYVRAGYVEETDIDLPLASISETDDYINIGVGWVYEERSFEKGSNGSGSADITFGVVDENGKFQPLNGANTPPTAVGDAVTGKFYTFATDRNEPSTESGSSGGGSGSFAKVTEFIAPYDAFSAVSAIEVSGFGVVETWNGDIDYSDWNGTYAVTATTFLEGDLKKRIFKKSGAEKYFYYIDGGEWDESAWGFHEKLGVSYATSAEFYAYNLQSGSWYNYNYELDVSLTINQVTTNYPEQPLVLKAVSANYANGVWTFGTSETDYTEYEENPKVNYIYAATGTELIGSPISRDILYIGDELVLSIPFASETMIAETGQQLQHEGDDSTYTTLGGEPCVYMDGGHFYTAEKSGFVGNMNRSFSFWAFPTTDDSYVNAVGCGQSQSSGRLFNCGACTDGDYINATFTTWGNDIYFNAAEQDNKLHHFVYIYNNSTPDILTVFVDGVKYVENLDTSVNTEESPFYLGRSGGGSWWYRGYLAKVRCYKTILTDNEVKKLFNDKK